MTSDSGGGYSPVSSADKTTSFGRARDGFDYETASEADDIPRGRGSRRSTGARNRLVIFFNFLLTSAVLAILAAGATLYFGNQTFNQPGPLKSDTTALIKKGAGLDKIVNTLASKGIIDQPLLFKWGIRVHQAQRKLKAGEYAFTPGMSMRKVMNTLISGKAILHAFTAPEGLSSVQIMQRLAKNDILVGDMPKIPVEGALLPETYNFQRGETRENVVNQMITAQKKALADIWAARDQNIPISTPEELVILASIVEKETGVAHERPLVASIFINRLNKGMKLQSDPTIIYGIFGGQGKPKDRPIYRSDIDKPTPYNTYTIPALPPGPIANPGRASMEAVAHPAQSEFLYFVADGTGGHAFAETLKQHEANVVKWRAIEKKRSAEAENTAPSGTDN